MEQLEDKEYMRYIDFMDSFMRENGYYPAEMSNSSWDVCSFEEWKEKEERLKKEMSLRNKIFSHEIDMEW